MAYTPTEWKDHIVQYPNRFRVVDNGDGTVDILDEHGNIIQQGTPVNAANLNKMEQGIKNAHDAIAAHLNETTQKFLNVDLNIIDMAVELETLKDVTLNGVTANIFVETFQNLDDINLERGSYNQTQKRLEV